MNLESEGGVGAGGGVGGLESAGVLVHTFQKLSGGAPGGREDDHLERAGEGDGSDEDGHAAAGGRGSPDGALSGLRGGRT